MNYKNTAALGACLLLFYSACERPDSPDFNLEHQVQVPVTTERTYQFLGNSDALIDTTKEDFSSLFVIDETEGNKGLVRLSKREDFEIGNLDDAIPEVNVNPVSIYSEVGEIELGTFNSGGAAGTASFSEVTGSPGLQEGDPLPGTGTSPTPAKVTLTTDYFESAVIKSGSIKLILLNDLGFHIQSLDISILSGPSETVVGSGNISPFADEAEETVLIPITPGATLEQDLKASVEATWNAGDEMQRDSGDLIIEEISGDNLIASEVEAVVPSQDFFSSGVSIIDNSDIEFTEPDHYIELDSGQLLINNIVNDIDLDIDPLRISFPDIRSAPYTPADSLVVTFEGDSKIGRKCGCGSATDKNVPLSDVRIYAEGNSIDYNIAGVTENTQQGTGSPTRTIHENDGFAADVELDNLQIREAFGVIAPRDVLINDDVASNGTGSIDLFNDEEAEVIRIDGFKSLSEQIDGLQFADPLLSIIYNTNLGVETTIYAAIAGKSANGHIEYLTGKSGEEHYVGSSEVPDELKANGQTLSGDKLIKFDLDKSPDGTGISGINNFDKEKTNVDEFMSNLPTEVHFIGLARLNENTEEGIVVDPVRFDPGMNVDLPLHFASGTATFSDTADADLGDLPKEGDKQSLIEATVTIGYVNNLPFRLDLSLIMLNARHEYVTEVPLQNEDPAIIGGATVDAGTRFVENGHEGKVAISLNEEQLAVLNNTRHMVIRISFNPTNQEEVKVRAEDSVSLSVKMSVAVKSNIN